VGYRSDFVFIIHGEEERGFNPLAKLWAWLHLQSGLRNTGRDFEQSWYEYFIENLEESRSAPDENYLFFSDESVKMYSFDAVFKEITDFVEEELNLEWEFVRIGEDTDDNEQKCSCNCDTRAWISRSIEVH